MMKLRNSFKAYSANNRLPAPQGPWSPKANRGVNMSFSNRPKILRGAFMEYGLSAPPLFVVFQFNPEQLTRNRSLSFSPPNEVVPVRKEEAVVEKKAKYASLRDYHKRAHLSEIQADQVVTVDEETIRFDIRLDATGRLNDGDFAAEQLGIGPQLAALELMVLPKSEGVLGSMLDVLLPVGGFSFTRRVNPPMVLFIWGRKRVLPVNITGLDITETEFNTRLEPVRATAAVNLKVIEGMNVPYNCTRLGKEAAAAFNLADAGRLQNVIIPG